MPLPARVGYYLVFKSFANAGNEKTSKAIAPRDP